MTRFNRAVILRTGFSACVCLVLVVNAGAAKRPNVVIMMADDLGSADIGCYGGQAKTPTLDRLAARGIRFTEFHSGANCCSPSRATALTGRHHIRAGVYHVISPNRHAMHLLEREITIAEVLGNAGYDTAHIGKWHLGMPRDGRYKPTPDKHGFDYWFATSGNASPSQKNPTNLIRNGNRVGKIDGYACQLLVDDAINWLDKRPHQDAPFFLHLWWHEPHSPIAAPDEIVSQYGDLTDRGAIYIGTIDNQDRALARLLAKIEEVDSLDNTLIVYSSDHGSYRSDRNGSLRGTKGSNFQGGIRSPGIFFWPDGIQSGRLEHEPAGSVDLLPTVCGLLGIDKPKGVHLDGSDLTPLLTGNADKFVRHQPLFWLLVHASRLPGEDPTMTIRDGTYTLVGYRDYDFPIDRKAVAKIKKQVAAMLPEGEAKDRDGLPFRSRLFSGTFADKEANRMRLKFVHMNELREEWIPLIKSGGYRHFELYDLSTDPEQQRNIATEHPDIVKRLSRQLVEIHASVMADGPDWHL